MKSILKQLVLAISLTCAISPTFSAAYAASPEPAFVLEKPSEKTVLTLDRQITESGLAGTIGKANVKPAPISIGEGETMPGLVLFPKKPDQIATVIWKDSKKTKAVGTLQITGPKTSWRTNFGLNIGMTLKDVQKLNGKPFKMAGFDWDGGGLVTGWNGGNLQKQLNTPKANVMVHFIYRDNQKVPDELIGDREIFSNNPKMQALNPHIEAISIDYQ